MITANALGAQRLLAFMDEYGMQDLRRSPPSCRTAPRRRCAPRSAPMPGRRLTSASLQQPAGRGADAIRCKVTVKGDAIELDFAGAPPQLPRGGLNCTLNYTAAHATYPLKCMLTPNVRGNAGCYAPFTVTAPEGSI